MDEGNGDFQSLDSQQGRRPIGVVSAVERVKLSGDKQIQNPSQCKRCLQFGCTGKTCCETHAELGDELPSPVLTENRKRKVAASPSSSNSVAAQAPDKPKRQKAPRSKSTPSRTPGSTMKRKAASTPRAPDTSRSPGPTTRRRAAGRLVSPRSWWSSHICCNQCVFSQLDVWCKCGHPVLCKVSALICWCNWGSEVSCYLCKLIFAVGSL